MAPRPGRRYDVGRESPMNLRKSARGALWVAGGLAAIALLLYLLRWPLLEGRVRRELARAAAESLRADLEIGRLEGSLLSGFTARDLLLRPRPGAAFREASVRAVVIRYGLFGRGTFEADVAGARAVLAPPAEPVPVHRTIREAFPAVDFRPPGRVRGREIALVLADGSTLEVDEVELDPAGGSVRLRAAGVGAVEVRATFGPAGALELEGRATEGPVRRARVGIGPAGPRRPLTIEAEVDGRALSWSGEVTLDAAGRLERAQGELAAKEGRARTEADFAAGRGVVEVDATVAVRREIEADVAVTGRAEGPLEGPLERWVASGVRARASGATVRGLRLDAAEALVEQGSLERLPFRFTLGRGGDRAEGEGTLCFGNDVEVEASFQASAASAAPYLALLREPLPLKASDLLGRGRVTYGRAGLAVDASVEAGPGSFQDVRWESLRTSGSLDAARLDVRELVVRGSPLAPSVALSGTVEGGRVKARAEAGEDRAAAEGTFSANGDVEATFALEGPLAWLRAFGVTLPEFVRPLRAEGSVSRKGELSRLKLKAEAKELSFSPEVTLRGRESAWRVEAAPGEIRLGGRTIEHERIVLDLSPGRAVLAPARISWREQRLSARLGGAAAWDSVEIRIDAALREPALKETRFEDLEAHVALERPSGEATARVAWGREGGEVHLAADGRLGRQSDFRLALRVPRLDAPIVRRFLPEPKVEGAATLEARVTGELERAEVAGALKLEGVSILGAPGLGLEVPFRSEDGVLVLPETSRETAYGRLTLGGRVPIPGREPARPLDLAMRLETAEFKPLLDRLSAEARPWVPPGRLALEASLRGPIGNPELGARVEFAADRWKPPDPLGLATDLRVTAVLDAGGIDFPRIEGRLGGGPFRGRGRWDFRKPGRPLEIRASGEELLVVDESLVRVRISPEAAFTRTDAEGLRVTGRVAVPLALYRRDFGVGAEGSGRRSREAAAPRLRLTPSPAGGFRIPGLGGLDAVAIDLEFETTGECAIENGAIAVRLDAKGRLRGTAENPAVSGQVRARPRGEVKLATGIFVRIERAGADLPAEPGRDATVGFEGRTGQGPGAITIEVAGPIQDPSMFLRSDPPRSQEELLSLLAFGRAPGSVSGEAAIGVAAAQVVRGTFDDWPRVDRKEGLLEGLWERTSLDFQGTPQGLDRRQPWVLPPVGTARSMVVRTEYFLSPYLSVLADADREANLGGDVKLRVRFR